MDEPILTDAQQEYYETLTDKAVAVSLRLLRRYRGLLTSAECDDACERALYQAARRFDPERGDLLTLYRWIARRRAADRLRKKGYSSCETCDGRGRVAEGTCPQCRNGWQLGRREVHLDTDAWQFVADRDEDGEVDPLRPFEWSPEFCKRRSGRELEIIAAIRAALSYQQRLVWWVWAMRRRHVVTDADLARRFRVRKNTIRQHRSRARKRVEQIVAAAQAGNKSSPNGGVAGTRGRSTSPDQEADDEQR